MARRTRVRSAQAWGLTMAAAGAVLVVVGAAPSGADDSTSDAAAAAPTISVEPSVGLTPGQRVTVTGSGFTPGSPIEVSMCDDPLVDGTSCDPSTAELVTSDAHGAYTITYRTGEAANGHTCVPIGCTIGSSNRDATTELAGGVRLGFVARSPSTTVGSPGPAPAGEPTASTSPDRPTSSPAHPAAGSGLGESTVGAALAAPTLSVSPSSGLSDGQTVTITGSGFTPNSPIGVSQCDDPLVDGSSCDLSTAKIGNSNSSGGVTITYDVVDTINGHTCVPSGCLIGASNLNVEGEFATTTGLGFGSGSSTTTTPGSSPGQTSPNPSSPAGGSSDGGSTTTTADGDGSLAFTGPSDRLPELTVGGFVLLLVGAALTMVTKRPA